MQYKYLLELFVCFVYIFPCIFLLATLNENKPSLKNGFLFTVQCLVADISFCNKVHTDITDKNSWNT